MLSEFAHEPRIAYFSMEIALRSEIPTYAGGLGVLAGDTLRAAADLALPMVGVKLVSRAGYFRQEIDGDGRPVEHPATWDPARYARPLDAKVAVAIEGRVVWVCGWLYVLESQGAPQPVILLDTDLDENRGEDRELTHYLYGGDDAYRLKQEIVLGIGGARLLQALGFEVRKYHMNEGHSALLTLELLHRHAYAPAEVRAGEPLYDIPKVRAHCNFATHTPVEAGHDQFSYELVGRVLQNMIGVDTLARLSDPARVIRSRLAANESEMDLATLKRLSGENRVPSLSVLDGWWIEGCIEGVTGWSAGAPGAQDDARSLYDRLAGVVLPLYYEKGERWIGVMKGAISKNASYFNSHRMMRRYATEAYLR